jgi:hypothetical protein
MGSSGIDTANLARMIRDKSGGSIGSLHRRDKALERSLWVLKAAKDLSPTPRLTANEVHGVLSDLEVACSANSISVALTRASDREVVVYRADGEVRYAIAQLGRDLLDRTDPAKAIELWCAEPGKKWTAWLKIEELATSLTGELLITDPYYGPQSLHAVELLGERKQRVRLLTCEVTGRKGISPSAVQASARFLAKQKPNIEIHTIPKPAPFHDRYILSDNGITFVGHGLEGLGEKEAFVIRLDVGLVGDTVSSLRAVFETRWKTSASI